jgi:hypothetical protein
VAAFNDFYFKLVYNVKILDYIRKTNNYFACRHKTRIGDRLMKILNIKATIVLCGILQIFISIPVQGIMGVAPRPQSAMMGVRPQSMMGTLPRKVPLAPDQLKQGAKYVKKYPEFKKLNPDEGYRMHSAYQKSKVNMGLKDSKGHMFSKEEKARVQSKQQLRENLVNRYENPNGALPAH